MELALGQMSRPIHRGRFFPWANDDASLHGIYWKGWFLSRLMTFLGRGFCYVQYGRSDVRDSTSIG